MKTATGIAGRVAGAFLHSRLTPLVIVASVEVQVLRARDLDNAIETAPRVPRDLREDPGWPTASRRTPQLMRWSRG